MAKNSGKRTTIEGVVEYLNFSPKGSYEALLLKAGKQRVQINFPPEFSEQLGNGVKNGDRVTAEVEDYDDARKGQHPVYWLLSLAGQKGLHIGSASGSLIKGKVDRINFAKHGEPNGALLDSGYFVHLKPGGARAVDLKVGQVLEVQGRTKPAAHSPYQVIEADVVNGIDLSRSKHRHSSNPDAASSAPHNITANKRPAAKKAPAKKR
ncbi:MAG TPA: hypothetical protein VLJ11_15485 [Bryobacteraceae bacterium]|nr:hypothetical protein [Bryobacteraceae bacterium]